MPSYSGCSSIPSALRRARSYARRMPYTPRTTIIARPNGSKAHLQRMPEGPLAEREFDDDHPEPRCERSYEEEDQQERRIPQRVQLVGHDQIQGPQGRLVQRGQEDADDHERRDDPPEDALRSRQVEPFAEDRGELQCQHRRVQHDAPGHFEHHGARMSHDQRTPEPMWLAQIEQKCHHNEHTPETR